MDRGLATRDAQLHCSWLTANPCRHAGPHPVNQTIGIEGLLISQSHWSIIRYISYGSFLALIFFSFSIKRFLPPLTLRGITSIPFCLDLILFYVLWLHIHASKFCYIIRYEGRMFAVCTSSWRCQVRLQDKFGSCKRKLNFLQ